MKNFLVTADIKESYNHVEKNIFLGHWCLVKKTKKLKKNKVINYHWGNKKKFKKDNLYIEKTADKICKLLTKKLNKIHNLKEDYNYWRLIIYPWAYHYVSVMYDRWETVRIFLKSNKKKVYYSYQLKIDEKRFTPNNLLSFVDNTFDDTWNYLAFLRIIKHVNSKKIILVKKRTKDLNEGTNSRPYLEKRSIFNYFILIYEHVVSKFAFRFNKIIFESFSFPKKEFSKICIKNLIIPSLYKYLFKNLDLIGDLDFEKRRTRLNIFIKETKSKDKFFNFLNESLIKDLPISYFENFLRIKKNMSYLANKKKIIFSMRSWKFNDQFKVCMAELIKKKSEYFICEHGGGLPGEYTHTSNYISKVANHIRYDSNDSQLNNKKIFVLSPTISAISKNEINTNKNTKLNITFHQGAKYSNIHDPGAKAEEGIKLIDEVLKFVKCLPFVIRKNTILRSKQPYNLNIKGRFIEKFGKDKFNEHTKQNFYDFAKSSKLMIVNYPQTTFSESMYFNIPTILICNRRFWFFKKESLKMFELLKKNKMAFENFKDAQKHIVKNWDEIYYWWNSKNIQKVRKLYLKNFFKVEKNWSNRWSNFITNQKKKVFN